MLRRSPDGGFVIIGGRSVRRATGACAPAPSRPPPPAAGSATRPRPRAGSGRRWPGPGRWPAATWRTRCFRRRISYRFLSLVDDELACRSTRRSSTSRAARSPRSASVSRSAINASGERASARAAATVSSWRRPGCTTSSSSRTARSSARASSTMQEEGQEVALCESWAAGQDAARRPRPAARLGSAGDHARGRPGAAAPRSRAGSRPRPSRRAASRESSVASSALDTLESRSATRAWAVARPRGGAEVLLGERLVEHEGRGAGAPRRAARGARPAPSARRRLSGSWPVGSTATLTEKTPAFSNPPVRATDQPRSWMSGPSVIISSMRLAGLLAGGVGVEERRRPRRRGGAAGRAAPG